MMVFIASETYFSTYQLHCLPDSYSLSFSNSTNSLFYSRHFHCLVTQHFETRENEKQFISSTLVFLLTVFYLFQSSLQHCCFCCSLLLLFSRFLSVLYLTCSLHASRLRMRLRLIRLSNQSHPYSLHLSYVRDNQYLYSIVPFSGKLWNTASLSFSSSFYILHLLQERSFKITSKFLYCVLFLFLFLSFR